MNEVETYRSQVVDYSPANFEDQPPYDSHSTSNLVRSVLRRWYICNGNIHCYVCSWTACNMVFD